MTEDRALEIIRKNGIKPGQVVLVQWFLGESGAVDALTKLAEKGVLEAHGPLVAGVQEQYILKRAI